MIDKKTKQHRSALLDMQQTINLMERNIEMSYDSLSNYRQLWSYLLKQSWYREHLPEIRKYMERMETSGFNKHDYQKPQQQRNPKEWFIDRIGKRVIRTNPLNLNQTDELVTEDTVNRWWLDAEKGYIFEDR